LEAGNYFLVTLHRAENVDIPDRMSGFIQAFQRLHEEHGVPLICSLHPRTRSPLQKQGKSMGGNGIHVLEPLGLFDFVHLEQHALCVLTDSGTVQEECCLFNVPAVTLRDVTERPETIEAGSNILSGADSDTILSCVRTALNSTRDWAAPREYLAKDVSSTVVKILLGYRQG
jgi:UDP-N-acetylglucosamine 2-epimerase (non-hydrolysing)